MISNTNILIHPINRLELFEISLQLTFEEVTTTKQLIRNNSLTKIILHFLAVEASTSVKKRMSGTVGLKIILAVKEVKE